MYCCLANSFSSLSSCSLVKMVRTRLSLLPVGLLELMPLLVPFEQELADKLLPVLSWPKKNQVWKRKLWIRKTLDTHPDSSCKDDLFAYPSALHLSARVWRRSWTIWPADADYAGVDCQLAVSAWSRDDGAGSSDAGDEKTARSTEKSGASVCQSGPCGDFAAAEVSSDPRDLSSTPRRHLLIVQQWVFK